MPGLPELPIKVPEHSQVDGEPEKYGEIWQSHRGPKPAPALKNGDPNPLAWMQVEETP